MQFPDLHSYSLTDVPAFVHLGRYTSISFGVVFMKDGTHLAAINHKCVYTTNWNQPDIERDIEIGNDVWIGQGAKIFQGVKIGNGAIIGAFAVINRHIPPYAVVVGNPPKIARIRFTLDQIIKLEKIKWWDWLEVDIEARKKDMEDIDVFLSKYA